MRCGVYFAGSLSSPLSRCLPLPVPILLAAMLRLMVMIPLNVAYVDTASAGSGNLRGLLQGHNGRWNLLNKDAEEREFSLIGLQQVDQKAHRPGEAFVQAVYTFKDP